MGKGRIFLEAENMPENELELYLKSQMPDFEYQRKDSGLIIDLQGSKKEDFLQNLLDIQVGIKTFGAYEPSVYDIFIALAGGGQDE